MSDVTNTSDEDFMGRALDEARAALEHDDVPIGAVLVRDGVVIATAHNRREIDHDPTAHAELLVLRAAAKELGDSHLADTTLYVTVEPCAMCAGALVLARVRTVVLGADNPKAGALGSLYHFGADPRLNHEIDVRSGVRAEEAGALLTAFFAAKR
jgi:tRNA(adenine34) deaminase